MCLQRTKILLSSLFLLLSGCGYRWHYDYPEGTRPTLMVPFIAGDEEALLTMEIISYVDASGIVDIVPKRGDYRLEVKLLGGANSQIGYRRDPQQINGQTKKNLLASEGRRTMSVEARLYRGSTEELAFGPYSLTADADYDYVDGDSFRDLTFISSSGVLVEVLPFSLGQLESIESAQEAVQRALYRRISQKIVDVISAEW
jgi:hypothetical protein